MINPSDYRAEAPDEFSGRFIEAAAKRLAKDIEDIEADQIRRQVDFLRNGSGREIREGWDD